MTIVTTQEFNSNQPKYFDMAVNSDVCIKDDKYLFQLLYQPVESDIIFAPDDDFYKSIPFEEVRDRVVGYVKNKIALKNESIC